MRVLQVVASGLHGGAELFYEDLVCALARTDLSQACVIRRYPTRAARLEAAGCPTTMLRFGGPLDVITPFKLARVTRAFAPDLVLGWMNRACRILPKGPWRTVGRLGGYYDLKYYRRCSHLICNTPDIVAHVIRHGWSANRVFYAPNFCPVREEPPVDRPAGTKVLLILARLQPAKGIDVAIRALAQIDGAVLWVAGDGPEQHRLERLTADLGLDDRVRFLGWRDDRSALLKAADICLVPSRHEPFGNVVVNAWAHGTPLIAAASQGPKFLVRDGEDGLLVPVDDAPALAVAINRVLGDAALGAKLAHGGRARATAEFSENAVVARYRDIFAEIVR